MNKEELKKYVPLMKEAEDLRKRAEQLEDEAKSIKAVVIDGMPKGSGIKDNVGNVVANIEKIRSEYLHKYDEALCELYKIERTIERLESPVERMIMRKRYIENKRWEDICVKLGYEWAQIHRIHARALRKVKMI